MKDVEDGIWRISLETALESTAGSARLHGSSQQVFQSPLPNLYFNLEFLIHHSLDSYMRNLFGPRMKNNLISVQLIFFCAINLLLQNSRL
jgi:hypothetical protein